MSRKPSDPWLHLYGQYQWHSPSRIVGTRDGLLALKEAVARCLEDRRPFEMQAFASDGEGYQITVEEVPSVTALARRKLPYTAQFAKDT